MFWILEEQQETHKLFAIEPPCSIESLKCPHSPILGANDRLDLLQRRQISVLLQDLLVPARCLHLGQFLGMETHLVQAHTGPVHKGLVAERTTVRP